MRTVEEIKEKLKELEKQLDREISFIENCETKDEWNEFVRDDCYAKADEINSNIKLLEWVLGEENER
ncbi:hypothetical protein A2U11_10175 [Fusobacterium necrophorum subsp. funduliforme]|uniref:hypothetical protein n=1 Tax=Fusobacterium necrophorum TaxID=859 RepID=UPI0007881C81|nr:hypothetical protein [Fusobacterium necrophorum]KYM49683.1 hypothetical protein A2U11_10175 [Fusobacterium necrophorum subsp. funduliforme]